MNFERLSSLRWFSDSAYFSTFRARGENAPGIQLLEGLVQTQASPIADEHYQLGVAYLKVGKAEPALGAGQERRNLE
jgi:hypothetical protein